MLSCAWEGVKKVRVGQLGACGAGVRCSLVLHQGGGEEYKGPLCVCVERERSDCACVSLLQVALRHSHV